MSNDEIDDGIGLKMLGYASESDDEDGVKAIEVKYDTYNRTMLPEYGPTELKLALVKQVLTCLQQFNHTNFNITKQKCTGSIKHNSIIHCGPNIFIMPLECWLI